MFSFPSDYTRVSVFETSIPVAYHPHITEEQKNALMNSPKFQNWVSGLVEQFTVLNIQIRDVYMFGKSVGFIFANADIPLDPTNPTSKPIPGAAFIRGGAVGILTLIKSRQSQQVFTVMTVQSRVPVSKSSFVEIPAGMLDGSRNFSGVAAQEMKEETGLSPNESDLVYLGNMYPSAGGCDEVIGLFCYGVIMDDSEIAKLQGKCTGLREHGEAITLKVSSLDEEMETCEDAKFLSAVCKFEHMMARNQLSWKEDKLVKN
jgi:ADP-sugar diphosphatase